MKSDVAINQAVRRQYAQKGIPEESELPEGILPSIEEEYKENEEEKEVHEQ